MGADNSSTVKKINFKKCFITFEYGNKDFTHRIPVPNLTEQHFFQNILPHIKVDLKMNNNYNYAKLLNYRMLYRAFIDINEGCESYEKWVLGNTEIKHFESPLETYTTDNIPTIFDGNVKYILFLSSYFTLEDVLSVTDATHKNIIFLYGPNYNFRCDVPIYDFMFKL